MTENKELKIYKKLANIQGKIKELSKTKLNKFSNYKYFGEADAITDLKPLMDAEKVALTWGDSPELQHFIHEKVDKDHVLRYLKVITLGDGTDVLTFYFWAMGQDTDISKAKGKAETYAYKYFLSKFFMMPVVDNLDPDKLDNKKELTETEKKQVEEILERHKLKGINTVYAK